MKKKDTASSMSLSKYLAQAGLASRRKVVDLIEQGLVRVNKRIIKEPGYKLSETDTVTYLNKPVKVARKIYILLNKPRNYITTAADEQDRKTVLDLIDDSRIKNIRLYPIGRLDQDTTGLLILTNDGDFAQRLAHPRYNIQKIYAVTLNKFLTFEHKASIEQGLALYDGSIKVDAITFMPPQAKNHVKVILHSGKNRIVRRIFQHLGYEVKKLDRIGYAGLHKKGLPIGRWRYLTPLEIENLK